jgi:hypothetical protein
VEARFLRSKSPRIISQVLGRRGSAALPKMSNIFDPVFGFDFQLAGGA